MALSDSEIQRIRSELGYNVLSIGAEPYIQYTAIFEQVIQQYINTEAATTSSTTVTASTAPAVVTLTVGSTTGFTAGDTVIVDVDSLRERATIRHVASATTFTVLLKNAHSGTYPVQLESGETIARDIIEKLDGVAAQIQSAATTAGIKKVDEIEFFGKAGYGSESQLDSLTKMRDYWRNQLSAALGVVSMWNVMKAQRGGAYLELY